MLTFLQNKFNLIGEKFASPLNVHKNSQQFWSLYYEDNVFGANNNAYYHKWTGFYEANPEYENVEL